MNLSTLPNGLQQHILSFLDDRNRLLKLNHRLTNMIIQLYPKFKGYYGIKLYASKFLELCFKPELSWMKKRFSSDGIEREYLNTKVIEINDKLRNNYMINKYNFKKYPCKIYGFTLQVVITAGHFHPTFAIEFPYNNLKQFPLFQSLEKKLGKAQWISCTCFGCKRFIY